MNVGRGDVFNIDSLNVIPGCPKLVHLNVSESIKANYCTSVRKELWRGLRLACA